jgi:hypothetical protein
MEILIIVIFILAVVFLFTTPFIAVPLYIVLGVTFWYHARKASKEAAMKEKGRLVIEQILDPYIESAADDMVRQMLKHSLSCPKCGKLALPELDTKRNYTCFICRTKFPSAIHNLTASDVFESPCSAIHQEVYARGGALPDDCTRVDRAGDDAWTLGWRKIGICIKKQK